MTFALKTWFAVLALTIAGVASGGCRPATEAPAKPSADATASPAQTDSEANGAKEEASDPPKTSSVDENQSADEPTPETQVADATDAQESTAKKSNKVLLGSPELTAGIPGEGPLTIEQIKAWLDDPQNHEDLEIELPLGLSAGAGQIKGVDQNPLTRAKIELGRQLYFDPRLGAADAGISCATCHDPDEGYTRHTQFGVGIRQLTGNRNSPVSYNRILSDNQFWDGRAASLEEQAVGPIANPIEMGNTHEGCVECLKGIEGYVIQFEKIFGDLTIENIGKAIASFERAIVTGPTPFDYYEQWRPLAELDEADLEDDPELAAKYKEAKAAVEAHPMSESAIRGRDLFFAEKSNCTACHVGANLTDEKYHNLGIGMDAEKPDLGRYEVTKEEQDRGAFKTPTIRNVALSAPYMHDGSIKTLEEVVEWYAKGGHPNPHLSDKIKKLDLTDQDKADLVEFMKACTGDFPKVARGRLPE